MLGRVPWCWMRHLVSPWRVVLTGALYAGKASLHTEWGSIPVRANAVPSMVELVQCNQLATREFADDHMGWWHIRASVSVSAAGSLGPQQCLRPGQPWGWKFMLLSSWVPFIPAMTTSFMSLKVVMGFPGGTVVKNRSAKQKMWVWSLGSGRSPGGGNGNPLQYSWPGEFHWQRSPLGYSPCGCSQTWLKSNPPHTHRW